MLKCVLADRDGETSRVVENVAKATGQMTVVKSCNSAEEAMDVASANNADLIFMDVLMPGARNAQILKRLQQEHSRMIALASKKEAAIDAFEMDAIDFILKPLTIDKLLHALQKVIHLAEPQPVQKSPYLFVKVNSRLERVDMKNIFQVEAMSDYVHIYTKEKKYTVHSTMKGIESKLPESDFTRVHKSFIVRLDCISEIEKDTLTVEKKVVPISVSYRKHLLDRLNIV